MAIFDGDIKLAYWQFHNVTNQVAAIINAKCADKGHNLSSMEAI